MERQVSMQLGVIVERRALKSQWQDYAWVPVAVVAGAENVADWTLLREGDDWAQFHAASLPLSLFARETEGYKHNLSTRQPQVFIVLRPDEDADSPYPVKPFLVTACPYEAQDYMDSSEEIVEGVAMSDAILAFVETFIAEHHVDEVFVKRKPRRQKGEQGPGYDPSWRAQ